MPEQKTLYAIGEALIDFVPTQKGCDFDEVPAFMPRVGGAPANVCGAFAKLGGRTQLLTQLGDDPFGHKIARELKACGVGVDHLRFTTRANTALAFVSLAADGNRTFSFYRNPSADLLMDAQDVDPAWFADAFALHFCSVSLGEFPMREAHLAALAAAQAAGAIISFDPNLRPALWPDTEAMCRAVWDFLPQAHLLKVSDEELLTLTGQTDIEAALPRLFTGQVQLVVYTCGSGGAWAFTAQGARAFAPSTRVQAVDATGAGDGFIGCFLQGLCRLGATPAALAALPTPVLAELLSRANRFCAYSVQHTGAIHSYPTAQQLDDGE